MQRPLDEELRELRGAIDRLDDQLLQVLAERFAAAEAIARHKARRGEPVVQPERAQQVRARYLRRGAELRLRPSFLAAVWKLVHDESCRRQEEILQSVERTAR
ncbi:chorismate mutase [Alicyclobacillus fructus]|uniref:chorismate mutase n=1 Tax=Alicyclobacillus fructus TaxID=2816082 RepID=UPI001A8E4FAC|nr:chorismate mutase [Alicyclobacillus fructus]